MIRPHRTPRSGTRRRVPAGAATEALDEVVLSVGQRLAACHGSLRHESLRTFAMKLAAELGYRRMLLLERRLDEPIADSPPGGAGRRPVASEDEIDAFFAFRPNFDRARVVADLAEGKQCFVLWLTDASSPRAGPSRGARGPATSIATFRSRTVTST